MANQVIDYSKMVLLGNRVTGESQRIFKNNTAKVDVKDKISRVDKTWIKSVFMISGADLDPADAINRYFTSAELKFTDTSMGGNIGINARPQFTRYADMRVKGRIKDRKDTTISEKGNLGMGAYYSEAIDDNSQNLYLEFGVPKFNSLFTFFSRSIDRQALNIAKTGRSSIAYDVGKIAGGAAIFLMLPVISVTIWAIKSLTNVVLGDRPFNYYYLNPTMHTYWSTVNTIVMSMATELGILIPEFMRDAKEPVIGVPVQINQEDMNQMRELMPHIIGEDNYIDVFAIATRAQAIANKQLEKEREMYVRLDNSSFSSNTNNDQVDEEARNFIKNTVGTYVESEKGRSFNNWLKDIMKDTNDLFQPEAEAFTKEQDTPATLDETNIEEANAETISYNLNDTEKEEGYFDNAKSYFKSAMLGGGGHAIFKVDYVGSVSESFSNSVTDVPSASTLKNISKSAKSTTFSFAGGNIAGGSDTIVEAAKNIVTGSLDGLTFGLSNSLATLFGDAYIDIPKMWDDSTAQLPKLNYSMQLISPYGNIISQLQNIYIPLAMLLAGALPLATGKSSYTSPFICKAFLKGVHNVQLGMITDLSITRGTSNLAFNKQKKVLALDISFSITDFSEMMTAPIDNSLFLGGFNTGLDENSVFGRYVSTLASRDLLTDMYAIPKAKIRLSRLKYGYDQATSSSYWAFRAGSFANDLVGFTLADKSLSLADTN